MIELDAINTVAIFGPVSSGKSYLISKLLENKDRVLQLDTTFEIEDDEWKHIWSNPQELCEYLRDNPKMHKIAYHPTNLLSAFEWCSGSYWKLDDPRWLILDECHEYASHQNFGTLMRYARKRKLGVLCASQRIADVPKSLTANSRTIIQFFTHEDRDHIAIKSRLGVSALAAVQSLRPCIYDDEREKVIQIPQMLVYRRGRGMEIHDLENGRINKIGKSHTEDTEEKEIEKDESENDSDSDSISDNRDEDRDGNQRDSSLASD